MNSHKNARLAFQGRKILIERLVRSGIKAAAANAGISERTAHEWLARHRTQGEAGLFDRTSRPHRRARRDSVEGTGGECVHVAIDDHSRVGFSQAYQYETRTSAIAFLRAAVAYYAGLGVAIARLLTDNGSAYRSKAFAAVCRELGIKHRFTRPYTPRTNGNAERFIRTALREWAYVATYTNSAHRQTALQPWMHRYNHHRPHSALGCQSPISRITWNNVSNLNS